MIRLEGVTADRLRDLGHIGWLNRAATRTEQNITAGKHIGDNIWSEVKSVFVSQQHGKCCYCERKLGYGGIEWDVEHFRPKKSVDAWPSTVDGVTDVGGTTNGYFLLAYDPKNYIVSCKICNTIHKGTYFPTARQRQLQTGSATDLREEQPYLINPADPLDADPETLIGWEGVLPRPAHEDGIERCRALVTIEVLKLTRDDLIRERTLILTAVWSAYQNLILTNGDNAFATRSLALWTDRDSPHSSCANAFLRLCQNDLTAAESALEQGLTVIGKGRRAEDDDSDIETPPG